MIQQQFADKVVSLLKDDPKVIGVAVAGSWLTDEIDAFSDLDLILVTKDKITDSKEKMLAMPAALVTCYLALPVSM